MRPADPVADPLLPLIAFARLDNAITDLCDGRIYGDELPETEAPAMPRAALVFRYAGMSTNVEADSGAALSSYRIDAWSYGRTPFDAARLRAAVAARLRGLVRVVIENTLVHSAIREAGPLSVRDPVTRWPIKVESFRVLVADQLVANS